MAKRRRQSWPRDVLHALAARREDVEGKLATFGKAMAMGIMNESTAEAMA